MLITPEQKVPQWSDTSQNDHKSKGLPVKKSDKNDLKRLGHPTFIRLFKNRFHSSSHEQSVCMKHVVYDHQHLVGDHLSSLHESYDE